MPAKVGTRPNEFKYGMALYGAAWPPGDHFFVAGGGGHGLVNRIVWARYAGGRCSDQVGEYKLGNATPLRMALAPSGSALLLGMSDGGVRRFQIDVSGAAPRVIEVSAAFSERTAGLRDEVSAMAFSADGGLLGIGFSNGRLAVLGYPGMKPLAEWRLPDGVKDMDFAAARGGAPGGPGALLATTCEDGSCQLWDALSGDELAKLPPPKGVTGAKLTRCRWSKVAPILYVAINVPKGRDAATHLAAYGPAAAGGRRASTAGGAAAPPPPPGAPPLSRAASGSAPGGGWALLKRQEMDASANAAFEISRSGRLLALGQSEGNLLVVDASSLHVVKSEPRASMIFVTRIAFADDDTRVLAVGGDANAFVLDLRGPGGGGGGGACLALLLFLLLLAAGLAYLVHTQPEAAAAFEQLRAHAADAWDALQRRMDAAPAAVAPAAAAPGAGFASEAAAVRYAADEL